MKKISTTRAHQIGTVQGQRLTIGLDLGDRSSWYCVLNEAGEVLLEQRLSTTPKATPPLETPQPPETDDPNDPERYLR
jgi:transposase